MDSQERWQVSDRAAHSYEAHVVPWFTPWAVDLVQRSGLKPGLRVLDVACGTGVVTRVAAEVLGESGEVVATDLNEGMLAEGRTHPIHGATVRWEVADATDLPFESATFDAVLCQQGLQFVPDKAAAVGEMKRVLKSGAGAAVSVWCSVERNPWMAALSEGLSRYLSSEAGRVMAAPCIFDDSEALAALFDAADFASVSIEAVEMVRVDDDIRDAIEGNLSALPIVRQINAMETGDFTAMVDHIASALNEYVADGALAVPARSLVLVATA